MTDLHTRTSTDTSQPPPPPPHAHYTLASIGALALVGAVVAIALAVGGIAITAGRNSVDDEIVAERVDALLAEADVAAASAAPAAVGEVIPALVPKGELPAVPAVRRVDHDRTPVRREPRMRVAAPFSRVFLRR